MLLWELMSGLRLRPGVERPLYLRESGTLESRAGPRPHETGNLGLLWGRVVPTAGIRTPESDHAWTLHRADSVSDRSPGDRPHERAL